MALQKSNIKKNNFCALYFAATNLLARRRPWTISHPHRINADDTYTVRHQGTKANSHWLTKNTSTRPSRSSSGIVLNCAAQWLRTHPRQGHPHHSLLPKSPPLPPSTSYPPRSPACTRSSTQHFSWHWERLNSNP